MAHSQEASSLFEEMDDPTGVPHWITDWQEFFRKKCHEDRPDTFQPLRKKVWEFIEDKAVENFVTLVIVFNMCIMILETDQTADGADPEEYISLIGLVLLGFYTVEIALRLYVWRAQFFLDGWNILDFLVVALDLSFLILELVIGDMPKISIFRMFRLVKLARAIRALNMFPELRLLLKSFIGAFKAIFWGILLIACITLIWSILAVQILHPVNRDVTATDYYVRAGCERCPDAFGTVFASFLTIWQTVVAGDSWGTVALPIIEESPLTLIFFTAVLVTVSMAIMNLILAVICEKATEVREEDKAMTEQLHKADLQKASYKFLQFCKELDADGSGSLSKNELILGFDSNERFAQTMEVMGFTRDNVDNIVAAFDSDGSGDVHYTEFVENMIEAKSQSVETMLMFLKLNVMETSARMARMEKMQRMLGGFKPNEASSPQKVIVSSEGTTSNQDKESKLRDVSSQNTPAAEKRVDSLSSDKEKMLVGKLRTVADRIDQEMNVVIQQVQGKVPLEFSEAEFEEVGSAGRFSPAELLVI